MSDSAAVSIVMVTHNAREWTERALRSLVENTDVPYELVAVDNASTDGTRNLLAGLEEARVLFNDENRGFGPANNQGAALATARHVLFLNSDALVEPGWLPPLLELLEDDRVAAVGPRLLNPDGSLQLAGALLSRSGSTLEYGFGDDPEKPEYKFRRDVDYLSGACLLVRRAAFDEVGGFDPVYGLGYFEDADLCLALARRGYRVVYEPRSVVTHARGASGGSEALTELALRNRAIFRRRWKHVLAARPLAPLQARAGRIIAARDAAASARILAVVDSADRGLVNRLEPWSRSARVTVLSLAEEAPAGAAEIEVAPTDARVEEWLEERRWHYDVVIAPPRDERLEAVLARTQPLAARVSPEAVSIDSLADAGIAPPADPRPDSVGSAHLVPPTSAPDSQAL
jgi:GT2 family glycosyltransferase